MMSSSRRRAHWSFASGSGINRQKTWAALFGIFFVQQLRPDVRKAEAIAAELIVRAEEHGRAEYIAEASNWLAYAKMVSGDFEHAAEGLDRAWALLESNAQTATGLTPQRAGQMTEGQAFEWRVGTRQNNRILSGWNLWFLGYPDRALERMNIATAIAHIRAEDDAGGHPRIRHLHLRAPSRT